MKPLALGNTSLNIPEEESLYLKDRIEDAKKLIRGLQQEGYYICSPQSVACVMVAWEAFSSIKYHASWLKVPKNNGLLSIICNKLIEKDYLSVTLDPPTERKKR